MKQVMPLKLLSCILIAICCISSCSREFQENEQSIFSTKEWNIDKAKLQFLSRADSYKLTIGQIFPYWKKARSYKTNSFSFVEIPAVFAKAKFASIKTSTPEPSNGKLWKSSIERLLLYKTSDGTVKEMIITYIPTQDYLRKSSFDISHNYLNNVDEKFDGFILYEDIKRLPLFILKVRNGKGVSRTDLTKRRQARTEMMCEDDCVEQWQQMCVITSDPLPGQPTQDCFDPIDLGELCTYECEFEEIEEDPCLNSTDVECTANTTGGGGYAPASNDRICGSIALKKVGSSWTGQVNYLQALFVKSNGWNIRAYLGHACISIPSYNNVDANKASAIFVKAYNDATNRVTQLLNAGELFPSEQAVHDKLKSLIGIYLHAQQNGASMSAPDGCLGDVPRTDPTYCF